MVWVFTLYYWHDRFLPKVNISLFPVGEKPYNAMHSVTIILKTRMTKAELHIKGIKKVYIQFAFKVDFLLCLSSYVRSNYGKFVDSKSSRCKAKMPGVVGG